MRTIILTIILILSNIFFSFGQDSLYVKKIDTIFITYDFNLKNEKVIKKYKSIETKENKKKGVRTVYNFLDSIQLKRKMKFYNYKGNINGSVGGISFFFGLYFIHNSSKNKKPSYNKLIKDPFYKQYLKLNFNKKNITTKDSINFNKQVFSRFNYLNSKGKIMLNENELENKTIFKFDGSTKKYKELLKLSKESYYFFVLDNKYSDEKYMQIDKKKYGMVKTNYFIFNEVFFPSSNQVYRYLK